MNNKELKDESKKQGQPVFDPKNYERVGVNIYQKTFNVFDFKCPGCGGQSPPITNDKMIAEFAKGLALHFVCECGQSMKLYKPVIVGPNAPVPVPVNGKVVI